VARAISPYILTEKATILSRTSVQHITKEEFETYEMQERVRVYHETLNSSTDAASEYIIEDDDNDLVKDDVI